MLTVIVRGDPAAGDEPPAVCHDTASAATKTLPGGNCDVAAVVVVTGYRLRVVPAGRELAGTVTSKIELPETNTTEAAVVPRMTDWGTPRELGAMPAGGGAGIDVLVAPVLLALPDVAEPTTIVVGLAATRSSVVDSKNADGAYVPVAIGLVEVTVKVAGVDAASEHPIGSTKNKVCEK